MSVLRPAITILAVLTALTGLAYPLAVTGIAQVAFPEQADGSLVRSGDKVVGSRLIGQSFTADRYFHPRPSATSGADPADPSKTVDRPYNATASTGSNLGPTSARLAERLVASVAELRGAGLQGPIPGDAVTTSASGLDPDISMAFARAQVPRVAAARGLSPQTVQRLLEEQREGPALGLFGEPRVNVFALNRALDRAGGDSPATRP
jgi:K+-transporting ATPase ATPase C chain